jgi:predicted acetyltransferase
MRAGPGRRAGATGAHGRKVRLLYLPRVPITIRPVTPNEVLAWFQSLNATFFIWDLDPEQATTRPWVQQQDPDRRIAAFDGDRIVGTYRTFASELTLPGGEAVPVSAVTAATTRPTHRRQGILTSLVRDDIERCIGRGDAASVLFSAEWPIYGRYGYGVSTWLADWTLRSRAARFLTEPIGSIEIITGNEARQVLPGIYERYRVAQAGEMIRPEHYWDLDTGLAEPAGRPRWKGSMAIHRDADGTADGFVRYTGEEHWDEGIPDNTTALADLVGATPAVEIELWRYLASLDLVAQVKANGRRVHEPFTWCLADARAAQVIRARDGLWIRPYDVPRLLGERAYDREGDLVIEVEDRLGDRAGPAAGRFRLEASAAGARCRATKASPDLTITAAALGAASLGGTRLFDATRAGGGTEHRAGALGEADRLLRTADEPFCSTFF